MVWLNWINSVHTIEVAAAATSEERFVVVGQFHYCWGFRKIAIILELGPTSPRLSPNSNLQLLLTAVVVIFFLTELRNLLSLSKTLILPLWPQLSAVFYSWFLKNVLKTFAKHIRFRAEWRNMPGCEISYECHILLFRVWYYLAKTYISFFAESKQRFLVKRR